MVTVELALGVGSLVIVCFALLGVISTVALQLGCQSAAGEIARQAARGDAAAVRNAIADLPTGARVQQQRSRSGVKVIVTARSHPYGRLLPPVTVSADSAIAWEPGEGDDG